MALQAFTVGSLRLTHFQLPKQKSVQEPVMIWIDSITHPLKTKEERI